MLDQLQNSHLTALFLDSSLKSLIVLLLAGAVCVLWRRAAAATRYLIWFLALASLPLLPLLASVLPSWQKPIWSVSSDLVSGNQVSLTMEIAPLHPQMVRETNNRPIHVDNGNSAGNQNRVERLFAARFSRIWLSLGLAVWCGGVTLVMAYLIVGQLQLRKLSRPARRPTDEDWTRLLNESCETLGLRRPVNLLQTSASVMPLTWGWLRPVLLLPAEAGEWSEGRKRIVLLHELAHIKRRDCLTQYLVRIICALYWFNPLVWLAARRMCVEREQACDDLVLTGGCKPSEYAGHLVDIASSFRRVPQAAAIAMARPSGLEKRVTAIVNASRPRRLRPATALAVLLVAGITIFCVGGWSADLNRPGAADESSLRQQQMDVLRAFSMAKFQQSEALASAVRPNGQVVIGSNLAQVNGTTNVARLNSDGSLDTNFNSATGEEISPEFQQFFAAATNGDWQTVTNMFESFKERHPQYEHKHGAAADASLATSYWQPVLEICMAYDNVAQCDPKYTQIAVDDIINSIPPDSIYFGGTDPGRALPTAFTKSQIDGDPFYTLTQNALANGTYLDYLHSMYGGKIYTPSETDSQQCFNDYCVDAQKRLENHQFKPGEDVTVSDGKVMITGQVAVMGINGLLARMIFDKNPNHEFYIEESFPLDWMYPYLEPHGLIMKINRQPLDTLSDDAVQQDHEYWTKLTAPMIGGWLNDDTPVSDVAAFANKVFAQHDFDGFTGDPEFVQNAYAPKMFAKWRSAIAGLYAWRAGHATDAAEKQRMDNAADFAFRQTWALCPYSPEAVYRYVTLLTGEKRYSDALLIAQTAAQMPQTDAQARTQLRYLISALQRMQQQK